MHKAAFCPPLEPKCPNFHSENGKMEVANRGYQFLKIGNNIISNCRKIIYTFPDKTLPETKNLCKEIVSYFTKKEKGKRRFLDFLINQTIDFLSQDLKFLNKNKENVDRTEKKINNFYIKLNELMEKEFSSLSNKAK